MWKIPPVKITQIDPFQPPVISLPLPPPPPWGGGGGGKEGVDIFWNQKLGEKIFLMLKLMVATNARYIQYLKKIYAHICSYFEKGTLLWLFGTTKNREYFAKMYQIKTFNSASQSTIIYKK